MHRIAGEQQVAGNGRLAGMTGFWLLAYIALLPYQWAPAEHIRLGIADLCLFCYLLFGLARMRVRKEAWGPWHMALVTVFALGVLVIVLRTGTLSSYVILNKAVGLLVLLASYWAITTEVGSWPQMRKLMRVFVLGVSFQNVFALAALLASYLAGVSFSFMNYGNERLSGMMYDPNAYGGLLVTALAFNTVGSTGPAPVTRGLLRHLCNLTLALGVIFTFSRSTWMSLAAVWLTYLFLRPAPAMKMLAVLSAALPVLAVFIGLGLVSPQRMLNRPDTIEGRVELIDETMEQFRKYPVLGMGLGGFREYNGIIVHNTPLWFLVDFGLVGLGVFLGFLGWTFLSGLNTYFASGAAQRPYVHAVLAANSGMLGLSMGIEAFYQRHWWLCFALIAAARLAARQAAVNRTAVPEEGPAAGPWAPQWRPAVAGIARSRR
ncbi:MAG TPA: O-antigen ligase family protein [Bryobacteraceae bacterium]|nr:O-antigen ligase family protein [Bryobacteraceae bacterium]